MAGGWYGIDEEGRLVIPSTTGSRTGRLVFRAAGALLRDRTIALELDWEDFVASLPPIRSVELSGWSVVNYGDDTGIGLPSREGLAVEVHGENARVVRLTNELGFGGVFFDVRIVTLVALCRLLRDRPTVRPSLDEPDRISELVPRLNASRATTPSTPAPVRRSSTDIATAMRLAGYTHPYGRPIPGDDVADEDEIVRTVMQSVARNPHAKGHPPDEDQVRKLARRFYLDIEPWPFQALTRFGGWRPAS